MRPLQRIANAIDVERSTIERDIPRFVINEQVASSRALARAALLAASKLAEEAGEQHVSLWLDGLADDMEPGR